MFNTKLIHGNCEGIEALLANFDGSNSSRALELPKIDFNFAKIKLTLFNML